MITSPITGNTKIKLIRRISTKYISDIYRKNLSVDVTKFFNNLAAIDVYECCDTGYRFYYPFSTAGDAELYKILQNIPWYYSEGKSEHKISLEAISSKDLVLEVGCGNGIFLNSLKKLDIHALGLELSPTAIHESVSRGHNVLNETIEDHARYNNNKYDVVASFQVLEHVVDVRSFLNSCITVLKAEGLLIISVPNNDAAYHRNYDDPLNLPPHHMGLWGVNSLIALQSYFPLRLAKLATDTSTPQFWVQSYSLKVARERLRSHYGKIGHIMARIGAPLIRFGAETMVDFIPGQTITAFFRKIVN